MWLVDAANAPSERLGPERPGGRIRTWRMDTMSLGQARVDRRLPDSVGGLPRHVSIDVHHCGWQLAGMSDRQRSSSRSSSRCRRCWSRRHTTVEIARRERANSIGVSSFGVHDWTILGIGFAVAFVVAYSSVTWFMISSPPHDY